MTPSSPAAKPHRPAEVIALGIVVVALCCGCTSADRPSMDEWAARWEQSQELVPTDSEIASGGRRFCDALVGELRAQLDDLEPTPDESIDPAFESWSSHVRTLAFECPAEPTRINAQLATISALAAEIRAALRVGDG